jgi:hypothetical protein
VSVTAEPSPAAFVESPGAESPFIESFEPEPEPVVVEPEDDGTFMSAAWMANEILAATPNDPVMAEPEELTPEAELITKDMTLIARERKRRFRLR